MWIKQQANAHTCDRPYYKSTDPFAMTGDVWLCETCGKAYRVKGFDSGMQWDPYPTVILWERDESNDQRGPDIGLYAPGSK